jgi:hypothetical protein
MGEAVVGVKAGERSGSDRGNLFGCNLEIPSMIDPKISLLIPDSFDDNGTVSTSSSIQKQPFWDLCFLVEDSSQSKIQEFRNQN